MRTETMFEGVGEAERPGISDEASSPFDPHSLPSLLRIAAHQLSQPLTVCRVTLDLALLKARTTFDYRAACQGAIAALERAVDTVRMLQDLAHASGSARKRLPLELNTLALQVVEELHPLAESHQVSLRFEPGPEVVATGDEDRCHQAFLMIVHHAISRSPLQGRVKVSLSASNETAFVTVEGEGSPAEAKDSSRLPDSASPGFLGGCPKDEWALASPRIAVLSSGGWVTFENLSPPRFRYRISLPPRPLTRPNG